MDHRMRWYNEDRARLRASSFLLCLCFRMFLAFFGESAKASGHVRPCIFDLLPRPSSGKSLEGSSSEVFEDVICALASGLGFEVQI